MDGVHDIVITPSDRLCDGLPLLHGSAIVYFFKLSADRGKAVDGNEPDFARKGQLYQRRTFVKRRVVYKLCVVMRHESGGVLDLDQNEVRICIVSEIQTVFVLVSADKFLSIIFIGRRFCYFPTK